MITEIRNVYLRLNIIHISRKNASIVVPDLVVDIVESLFSYKLNLSRNKVTRGAESEDAKLTLKSPLMTIARVSSSPP